MRRLLLALVFSTNVRCKEQPMAPSHVSSRLSSTVPNRDYRRNRERPDPTPNHIPSSSAGLALPHPKRTGQDDTRTSWDEKVIRSMVLTSLSRPSGRFDPLPLESPAFFPLHRL